MPTVSDSEESEQMSLKKLWRTRNVKTGRGQGRFLEGKSEMDPSEIT
jgi:hypothetical protein